MTNEEINIAIAEACGIDLEKYRTYEGDINVSALKKYCNDLNAMHEAEETLDNDFYFAVNLYHLIIPQGDQYDDHTITWSIANKLIRATARQRAEAFLRTIGKWEGAK